ncbi:AzlD domain-containing protein [Roseovarius autotrophicus]|uniref:AzlD domain-containing protein n=1 Tax=Roseovarius autotrophicus TaxID=2824121 RepID=UPI0019F1E2B6|nr:AzlD domain-containing protein [Roseovarius autotrophicus]MBE0454975.1 AzlD domain-containing protein [Roseovarius sp.]
MIEGSALWLFIAALGAGTFGLRFVFLGLVGNRPLPAWLLRHLRYTAVAVLPGLVAPLVVWPAATGGALDAPRMAAALVTLTLGYAFRNVILAIAAGAATLFAGLAFFG